LTVIVFSYKFSFLTAQSNREDLISQTIGKPLMTASNSCSTNIELSKDHPSQ